MAKLKTIEKSIETRLLAGKYLTDGQVRYIKEKIEGCFDPKCKSHIVNVLLYLNARKIKVPNTNNEGVAQ